MVEVLSEIDNNRNIVKDSGHSKQLFFFCVVFFAIILGRAFSDIFCYVFIAFSVLSFMLLPASDCFALLVFILPFSTILKLSVSSMSLYTVLFFGLFIKIVLQRGTIPRAIILNSFLFGVYLIFFSGINQITTAATMIVGLLILRMQTDYSINKNDLIVAFSSGLCLSSVLALFRNQLPLINVFILNSRMKIGEGIYVSRFSGLQGNPNYYTVDIIFAIACLAVIIIYEKPVFLHYLLVATLVFFGLMSVSKSFILSLGVLLLLWFIVSVRRGGASKATKFFIIGAILVGLIYYLDFESINLFLFRFSRDETGTLNSLSTGRLAIWKNYFIEIFGNIKILVFGNGLNTVISKGSGAHNTYIEAFFSLGLVGVVLFLLSLRNAFCCKLRGTLAMLPLVILLIRLIAINMLTYDNLWIYFIILKVLSSYSNTTKNTNILIHNHH